MTTVKRDLFLNLQPFYGVVKKNQQSSRLVNLALHNTDLRLEEGKSVTPGFLFAALLWPVVQMYLEINKELKLTKKQLFKNQII